MASSAPVSFHSRRTVSGASRTSRRPRTNRVRPSPCNSSMIGSSSPPAPRGTLSTINTSGAKKRRDAAIDRERKRSSSLRDISQRRARYCPLSSLASAGRVKQSVPAGRPKAQTSRPPVTSKISGSPALPASTWAIERFRRICPIPTVSWEYKAMRNFPFLLSIHVSANLEQASVSSGPICHSPLELPSIKANPETLKVIQVDDLPVALVSQQRKSRAIDEIGDRANRAVGEKGVEPAGMRRAEHPQSVANGGAVVLCRRAIGMSDRIQIPAGRITLVVVRLSVPQKHQVQALFADQTSLRGS